jgi:hypothetical protein
VVVLTPEESYGTLGILSAGSTFWVQLKTDLFFVAFIEVRFGSKIKVYPAF